MIIYLENTLKLLTKEQVNGLIKQGEVKEVGSIKYLKIISVS